MTAPAAPHTPERPREIRAALARLRGALRALSLLHGTGLLLCGAVGVVAALFVLDYFLVLPAGVRLALLALGAALLGSTVWRRLLRPATRPLPDLELAGRLEASHPELADRLLAAVAFTAADGVDPRESGALVAATVAEAQAAAARVAPRRAAPAGRAWRMAGAGAAACALLAGAASAQPQLAATWWQRAFGADVRWPQRTRLTVLAPVTPLAKVGVRTRLLIEVQAEGSVPRRATLHLDHGAGLGRTSVPLARQPGDRFVHEMASVAGSFDFWVTAGDGETPHSRVEALVPPEIEAMQVWLAHPPHTRLRDTPIDRPLPDGNVRAPVGTAVRVRGAANKPIAEGALVIGGERSLPLTVDGAERRAVEARFDLLEDGTYVVRLTDTEGLEGLSPFRYRLRAVPDAPPAMRDLFPAADRGVTAVALLPLACEVRDDYGVAQVRVHVGLVGSTSFPDPPIDVRALPLAREADGFGPAAATVTQALDLATLQVRAAADQPARPLQVGDRLRLWFEAVDHRPSPEPNVSRTRERTLTIESAETLERQLGEQLLRLRQTVELARHEQERALARTEQLPADRDVAAEAAVVGEQRQVGRRTAEAAREFGRIAAEAELNRLGDPNYRAGLGELAALARSVAEEHTARAAEQLEAARRVDGVERRRALGAAREAQAQAAGLLAELLARLERWKELADVLWGLRRIQERQEQLRGGVLGHLKEKGGGD